MALTSVSLAKEKNFIKENWKPILGIGATIGVTYVVWNIYSDFKEKDTPGGLQESTKFEKSTISDAEAAVKADRLEAAMKTFGKASQAEKNVVRSILQELGYNDFIKVSQSFGERGYIYVTGIGQSWPAPKKNLVFWLTSELDPEDLVALNKVIPNVF